MAQKRKRRSSRRKKQTASRSLQNKEQLKSLLENVLNDDSFADMNTHGNVKWKPANLAAQALAWTWQETRNITDAFDHAVEVCRELELDQYANTYPAFMNALATYRDPFTRCLNSGFQHMAEKVGRSFFTDGDFTLMAFDGSRVTAPRTVSNEKAFCAENYGQGATAKYRKKKTKGMRRKKIEANQSQPPAPQVWVTEIWHMGLRLPWVWRLGPSNASERGHVEEMLQQEEFPENTLFCGDAGFVGYPLWSAILNAGGDFLVRVGGNVNLLSEHVDIVKQKGGVVLCWPKGQINRGAKPLRLRLVKVKVGKTRMWLLTSVLDRRRLSKKKMVRYYKMRWGIEVSYRGLKQTLDNHKLRCRDSDRVLTELDWSIRGMAFAELLALAAQLERRKESDVDEYDPKDRSLAKTIRALRDCMRHLNKRPEPGADLWSRLGDATVQKYVNTTDKRSRYRRKNPDKKPLGDPTIRKLTAAERKRFDQFNPETAP